MSEVDFLRRSVWFPIAIPPALAMVSLGSDPSHPLSEFLYLTILYGGLTYPVFTFLFLRGLRGHSTRTHWHFAIMSPILYGLFYTAINGTLLLWLYESAADAYGWAGVIGAVGIAVGYGCVVLVAALRYIFVSERAP